MRPLIAVILLLLCSCSEPTPPDVTSWEDCSQEPCVELEQGEILQDTRVLRVNVHHSKLDVLTKVFLDKVNHWSIESSHPVLLVKGRGSITFELHTASLCDGKYELSALVSTEIDFEGPSTHRDSLEVTVVNRFSDQSMDGIDVGCNGIDGVDQDFDGLTSKASGGTDCDDLVHSIGECNFPSESPQQFEFNGNGTAFESIGLSEWPDEGRDIDGDGYPDNALSLLFRDLFGYIDIDPDRYLFEKLEAGEFVLGMFWPSEGIAAPATFFELQGKDNTAQEGAYLVKADSFYDGTATPISVFDTIEMNEDGTVRATAPLVVVGFPFGSTNLRLVFENVVLEGKYERTEEGVRLTEGKMYGTMPFQTLMDAFNTYLQSKACTCLELHGPLIDLTWGPGPQACVGQYGGFACSSSNGEEKVCRTIADTCILLVPIAYGGTDIDTTGDGAPDSLSFLIRLEGEPTQIIGVAPR